MPTKRHRYSFPTIIEYGPGVFKEVAAFAENFEGAGLLVTDPGVRALGFADQLVEQFKAKGTEVVVFDQVSSNPTEQNVLSALEVYQSESCGFLVGLGGGSAIDAAKAVKLLATHSKPLIQYDDQKDGGTLIHHSMPPLLAIPTTAGTGSEVGRSTVINISNKKVVICAPGLMPDRAILDPELTLSLPPSLTAATGVDALVHNLEAYAAGF
jgi:4-hydroxybutyrate dehydrogenase